MSILGEYTKEHIINSDTFYKRLRAYVNMLTGKNIYLSVNSQGDSYTDGTMIVLSANKSTLENEKMNVEFKKTPEIMDLFFLGAAVHEAEHINSSNFEQFSKFIENVSNDYKSFYNINKKISARIGQFIGNAIEDGRIERRAMNRLPGTKKYIEVLNYTLLNSAECLDDECNDLLNNILSIAKINRLVNRTTEMYKDLELYKILESITPIIQKTVASNSTVDMFNYCWEVHKIIMPFIAERIKGQSDEMDKLEEFLEQMEATMSGINKSMDNEANDYVPNDISIDIPTGEVVPNENSESPNSEENETEETQQESGTKEAQEKDDESHDSNTDDEEKEKKSITTSSSDESKFIEELIEKANEEKQKRDSSKGRIQKRSIKENKDIANSVPDKEVVMKFANNHRWNIIDKTSKNQIPLPSDLKTQANLLKKALTKILENRANAREVNLRKGCLDTRRLSTLISNHNEKIFFKKEINDVEDYAFYMVIDISGSTSGTVLENEIRCAAIIESALSELVPLKIIAFNSETGGSATSTNIYVLKEFDKINKGSLLFDELSSNNGNCDSFALRFAHAELKKRKEVHKILFMVSDGLPSVSIERKNAIEETKEAAREIRKTVHLIPIAITGNNGFSQKDKEDFIKLYKDNVIFKNPNSLLSEVTKIIKKIIT